MAAEETIINVSKILGVPKRTIQYMCSSGLIPHVKRNRSHYHVLEPWQVDLLSVLIGMKRAGFSSKEIRQYSKLYRRGPQTEPERIAMLTTHKHQLHQEIQERQQAIDCIERQEEIFHHGNQQ